MALRNVEFSERFDFDTLGQLKRWLDQFKETDLDTVYFNEPLWLRYETERLSDGSKVHNVEAR